MIPMIYSLSEIHERTREKRRDFSATKIVSCICHMGTASALIGVKNKPAWLLGDISKYVTAQLREPKEPRSRLVKNSSMIK